MKEREIGIDLLKVIACIGVVALHTLKGTGFSINYVVALLAGICIPMFFIVNGYLLLRKEEISYAYVMRKIKKILIVCFSWELLHAIAHFLVYREVRNFLLSFVLDFFQKGLFFHFWFMGALIIVYLVLPQIHKLYKESFDGYVRLLVILGVLCVTVDILMLVNKQYFILKIPQTLRIWLWIFYYMLGGFFATKKVEIVKRIRKNGRFGLLICALITIVWIAFAQNNIFGGMSIECFYGSLPIILLSGIVFFVGLSFSNKKYYKLVGWISKNIMGIYIFHPFILPILGKVLPNFYAQDSLWNIAYWIVTVVVSLIASSVVGKIPLIKSLIAI